MKFPKFTKIVKDLEKGAIQHSPEILIGFGIAGFVTTAVLTGCATIKAEKLVEAEKKRLHKEKLTAKEVVKVTWKCFVPAVFSGSASAACLIFSSKVSARRNAALATAYKLSETALNEYKNKVVETLGESKEKDIRDSIAKDRIDQKPVKNQEIILTERGNTLCYDTVSGRYFRSDIETIRRAVNYVNKTLMVEMYVSLNTFYEEIGLPDIRLGEELGWNIDDYMVEVDFSSQLSEGKDPCLVIDYTVAPRYDYEKLSY